VGRFLWTKENRFDTIFIKKIQEVFPMATRVAVMSIIVENGESVESLNRILHENGRYIIGRMGIPYREKGINIISVAMDAPQDAISAMSGKIGNLPGVSVKTAYSSVVSEV
jgi:putative iron-only hydrogenase system regulator